MVLADALKLWLVTVIIGHRSAVPFNRPRFCPNASWNPTAITFANISTIGSGPRDIFITMNNTIYATSLNNHRAVVWNAGSSVPIKNISGNLTYPQSLFVTLSEDIYIGIDVSTGRIDKWTANSVSGAPVMHTCKFCSDIFVDHADSLYCSMEDSHQVVRKSLQTSSNGFIISAGTGTAGNTSTMLNMPRGIFVNTNFDLYVADANNGRVQLFIPGQFNASTVAGNTSSTVTYNLQRPTAVVLDGDSYLFIVDSNSHRIIGEGPNGFRCLVGCTGGIGVPSNRLQFPQSLAFDSDGNMFVTDYGNDRIQRFNLSANSCISSLMINLQLSQYTTASPVSVPSQTVVSYNRPKFCANATWNENATTFADISLVGSYPYVIHTTTNNTVYILDRANARLQVWFEDGSNVTQAVHGSGSSLHSFFVHVNGDVYVDAGNRVDRWTMATSTGMPAMTIDTSCYGLFVDVENTLYCSMFASHKVIARSLNSQSSTTAIVAGTGCAGSTANMLDGPWGIFVDTNLDLYVADYWNYRVQLFKPGQLDAITIASSTLINVNITFSRPTGIVLDADGYLYIVGTDNHRIVGLGPNGFHCVIGCGSYPETSSNSLRYPQSLAFGSDGNMFVADSGHDRIQRFNLATSLCTPTTTSTQIPPMANLSCPAPTIALIPGSSTLSTPLQFRRSLDFFIVSLINWNCYTASSTSTQWTIKNCTSSCVHSIRANPAVITTTSELYIPARTLPYGLYELKVTASLPQLLLTTFAYVQITPSGITANLIRYGTSMITRGDQQELQFNPGSYSDDPDRDTFNARDWKYKYYCRVYGKSMFPNLHGSLLTIDDLQNDPVNPSCLLNRTAWQFDNSINSSFTLLPGALRSNRTYQFMVQMENIQNSSRQATGYALVAVVDTRPQMILIRCVIWTLCESNMEFQRVNPTTQVALASECVGNCAALRSIIWNVYCSTTSSSANHTTWTLFNRTAAYQNIWLFGTNTANFTSTSQLFLSYPQYDLWRFEVVYTFRTEPSVSALNFVINQPPVNGSCSISPLSGTTLTPFTITCPGWFDDDGIKDYSVYAWTTNPFESTIVAFSAVNTFSVRLPLGDNQTSSLHLSVHVRDYLSCRSEANLSLVTVVADSAATADLIKDIQTSPAASANNTIVKLLAGGNQNTVGQVLTSVSQQFNSMSEEGLSEAVSNGVPAASVSISTLTSADAPQATSLNQSALQKYNEGLNVQATVRDQLVSYATNLISSTSNSIKLQAAALAEMTRATNELTRTTLTIVSERCYRLGKSLNSMKMKIPFEDAQAAANALLQCASNLLSAVNGPLQQRTMPLDLDVSRAQTFPADYDTDLEFEWANPNLFADGTDFSWETIQKNRNSYYQRQLANQVIVQMTELVSLVTSSVNIHLNIGQDFAVETPQALMFLEAKAIDSLSAPFVKRVGTGQVQLPQNINAALNTAGKVTIRSMLKPLAPFGNSKSTSNTNLSRSISLSFVDDNEKELPVRTNSTAPIEVLIPRDPQLLVPPMLLQNVTSMNSTPHNLLFHLHNVNLSSALPISVHWEIQPLDVTLAYLFIYRFDQIPQLNSSTNLIDGWTLLCPSNLSNDSIYRYFIDNQRTAGHQAVIVGIRELSINERSQGCSSAPMSSPPIVNDRVNFTADYQLRTYTSGCYYLDGNNQWKADGLTVGPLTDHYQTQCFSTHLTTFAGGLVVLPESVDWNYVFANADFMRNKTIYLTVIIVSVLYLFLIVYARFYDKKDLAKLGVTPLSDNNPADGYFYQLLVFTGQRRNAGTQSNVHFIIHGDNDATQVRTLADPHRRVLQRGGVDAFLLSVPESLGLLNCIQIWHDNTGKDSSSSWFLKYIIVRDLQTMEKFHFICQRWFAVEKDDGKIERLLPVSNETDRCQFSHLLNKRTYHSVSDGHLWFSIFSRPPSNQFTRVQRCTCCFVLLYVSMCLNILYYDLSKQTSVATPVDLPFGVVYIATQQIVIGVIVEVLALIPSLLLVQLFRRIGLRRQQQSPLRQALYKINPQSVSESPVERKKKKMLPWWCIFIAYGLCLILVAVSILFIIARGIEFGDVKTQQWLVSIISGFFSSILLTQPLKIVSLAILFAFFCGKPNDDKEAQEFLDDTPVGLDHDEEYLHDIQKRSIFTYRPAVNAKRLNEMAVQRARFQRLQEVQMWSILREACIYVCFLSVLYAVAYSNHNVHSFTQVDHLRKYLLNSRQDDLDYNQIRSVNEYWDWLGKVFVGKLRAQHWYNGDEPRNLSGFLTDRSNRLIGWATMRQLRVKTSSCAQREFLPPHCQYDYSWRKEDRTSYEPGWVNETTDSYNSVVRRAFQYQSGGQLDTYPYGGEHSQYAAGGYVYELRGRLSDLRSNISQLHQLGWIDNQTRAVIIQLTLYNPNVDLFTSVVLLAEFLSSTKIDLAARFEPISFHAFMSASQLICTIAYLAMIVYLMWIEVRVFIQLKRKYFYRLWSLIDVGIIVCSWTSVGMYFWRYREGRRIAKRFAETDGYVYVNLQLVAHVDNVLTLVIGFCCFFGTIKLIKLCRFHSRLCLFMHTLQQAGKELLSFSLLFSLVFMSFVCLFHLLFISKLPECSSVLATVQMLFEMTLMKFDAHELSGAAAFLGPFCFSLFILFVVFICMSMFLSIIGDNFRCAQAKAKEDKRQIFTFIWGRFQRWTGWQKVTEAEHQAQRDDEMRSQYYGTMELFVKRIDQLLEALNRVYVTQVDGRRSKKENTSD